MNIKVFSYARGDGKDVVLAYHPNYRENGSPRHQWSYDDYTRAAADLLRLTPAAEVANLRAALVAAAFWHQPLHTPTAIEDIQEVVTMRHLADFARRTLDEHFPEVESTKFVFTTQLEFAVRAANEVDALQLLHEHTGVFDDLREEVFGTDVEYRGRSDFEI